MKSGRRALHRSLILLFLSGWAVSSCVSAQTPANATPDLADELLQRLDEVDSQAPGTSRGELSVRRQWMLGAILSTTTMVTEDLTCIAGGLLVARHKLSFVAAATACFVGIWVGDMLLVLVGRLLGRGALERWPLRRLVSRQRVARSERFFRESGARVVFISRFVPGSRLPLFLAAGILRAPVAPIAGALALAALIWTPLLVGLSAWTGGAVLRLFARFERHALLALVVAAVAAWVAFKLVVPLASWRGRRLLLSRWRRLTKWEFWPAWIFELPVFLYVVRLGWKHGGIGTFAAANPGISAGGFVEESKSAILTALAGAPVARFALLELEGAQTDRRERARAAIAALADISAATSAGTHAALAFPVVLKPDIGERGDGVRIVRSEAELEQALESMSGSWIVQEYVSGEEFGLFYVREPGHEQGRILSITSKRFPVVVGDGVRPLGELILADERAVCMASWYLESNAHRVDTIPEPGERVQLVEIGNHCRGAIFLDGAEYRTPELERALDAIAEHFPGFHFGRFDVRTPSVESLRAGTELRILELNGVTSEATHIYAPGAGLFAGWRTLFEQWRLAFEIGAANIENGARRWSAGELFELLLQRRRRRRQLRDMFATISYPPADSETR